MRPDDKGHGREEQRRCEALPVPSTLRNADKWKDLSSISRVTRTYTERGEDKSEVRYFISSLPPKAKNWAKAFAVIGESKTVCIGGWIWYLRRTAVAPARATPKKTWPC